MNAYQIQRLVEKRLAQLQPAIEEYEQLTRVAEALSAVKSPDAPFGYKADGTPRKRPAPTARTQAKVRATRKAKKDNNIMPLVQQPRRKRATKKSEQLKLNVQTVTGPTEREMKDREVAHVTSGPA